MFSLTTEIPSISSECPSSRWISFWDFSWVDRFKLSLDLYHILVIKINSSKNTMMRWEIYPPKLYLLSGPSSLILNCTTDKICHFYLIGSWPLCRAPVWFDKQGCAKWLEYKDEWVTVITVCASVSPESYSLNRVTINSSLLWPNPVYFCCTNIVTSSLPQFCSQGVWFNLFYKCMHFLLSLMISFTITKKMMLVSKRTWS